jgi:IPT/TIG domain.
MAPTDNRTALARRFRLDVNMGTASSPDWQQLLGIQEFTPTYEPRREDDETYEDGGAMRRATTGYSWGVELSLIHRTASDGVTWNSVQERLRTAAEANDTADGEVQIRWYDRNGRSGDNYQGWVLVDWTPEGGEPGARDIVSVVLHGQGQRESLTNPLADLTPVVTGLDPATGLEAGGELVTVHGGNFVDVTAVNFGANPATDFTVVDATRIVAVAPAGTSTVDVTVTNSAGTSQTSAQTKYTYA